MRDSRAGFLSLGLQCLCRKGPDFERRVPANKRLKRLGDAPLAVVAQGKYCSTTRTELALKVKSGLEGYDVKSADGQAWFRVERKSPAQWNKRVVSDMDEKPLVTIERHEKSGHFKIWTHSGEKQRLAIEIRERWSFKSNLKKSREELRATLVGEEFVDRQFLKISGQIKRRQFSVTWDEDSGPSENVVAIGSKVGSHAMVFPDAGKDWFAVEIPAGVDAALMVALGVLLGERDSAKTPPSHLALPEQTVNPIIGFGDRYVSCDGSMVALSMEHDQLKVVDSLGKTHLKCGSNGVFVTPEEKPLFQLADGGFRMKGIAESNSLVRMSFSKTAGNGGVCNISMVFCAEDTAQESHEVVAVVGPCENTIPLYVAQDGEIRGTPIAVAVLGNQSPDDFEKWFYGGMERLQIEKNKNANPFVHVGIGAEVAAGVDIALVVATMLLVMKFLPAAMSSKPMLGVIHPSGIVRWEGLQWVLCTSPVSGFLPQCGLDHFGSQVRLVE